MVFYSILFSEICYTYNLQNKMCRFNEHRGERSISTMLVFVLYVDRHTFKQWNTVFFLMLRLCFSCTVCEKGKVSNSVIFYLRYWLIIFSLKMITNPSSLTSLIFFKKFLFSIVLHNHCEENKLYFKLINSF